jgi:hypothetical protein
MDGMPPSFADPLIDISYPLAYNCGAIFHPNLEA